MIQYHWTFTNRIFFVLKYTLKWIILNSIFIFLVLISIFQLINSLRLVAILLVSYYGHVIPRTETNNSTESHWMANAGNFVKRSHVEQGYQVKKIIRKYHQNKLRWVGHISQFPQQEMDSGYCWMLHTQMEKTVGKCIYQDGKMRSENKWNLLWYEWQENKWNRYNAMSGRAESAPDSAVSQRGYSLKSTRWNSKIVQIMW